MWSLPNIRKLNESASKDSQAGRFEQAAATGILDGEILACECAEWGDKTCSGEIRTYLWYDIFSDDPKGVLALCEWHDGYYGRPTEGFFECDDCGKVFVQNYTWENYSVIVDDAELCLPCAAARYIAETGNWIELTDEAIEAVDFARIRKAKHVIGVEMPVPDEIEFIDNAEFDSMDGHRISGDGVKDILRRAKDEGHTRALLILDAGYQFAVSIGVYVDANKTEKAAA